MWTELLRSEIDETYGAAEGLLSLVEDAKLSWKPETGSNWMTTGQLIEHLTSACGYCVRGFATGDWSPPEGYSGEDLEGDMLPPAEKMRAATSVADVRKRLAADRKIALEHVEAAGEKRLAQELVTAPWDPEPKLLGRQVLLSVHHLANHKAQLFWYLKLQGHPVHTGHLYGMGESAPAD